MLIPAYHPAFRKSHSVAAFYTIVAFRILFFSLGIYALKTVIELGTSELLLIFGAAAGVFFASRLSFSNLTFLGFVAILAVIYFGTSFVFLVGDYYPIGSSTFRLFNYSLHKNLLLLALIVASISTWAFWRSEKTLPAELIVLSLIGTTLLASHRNYRFDAPLVVNTMSWDWGLEPLTMLVILGSLFFAAISIYAVVATLPARPLAVDSLVPPTLAPSSKRKAASLIAVTVCIGIVLGVAVELYRYHSAAAMTRVANGVGQATEEGLSPLGFHSALGSTNQPSALVRLEGDYKGNPFTPMLYMRESSLADYNGKELVIAERGFDPDVSRSSPREPYAREEDPDLKDREKIVMSAYLMADHNNAFAVDYPISFSPVKNPNVQRFKSAFQAVSLAPAFALDSIEDAEVGDPRWTEKEVDLYLAPHKDPRYQELAETISQGFLKPIQKARAIQNYLAMNTIYTLTPNHTVAKDEDPVAPYLFGDGRGYCVHIAHATVYLLRALGIPARIGTGYLTDFSQARDGHILLRMSDRHAWAEIYITGKGWVPFDTQPQRVESHAETEVDQKLLEELMGLLEPGDEILPKDSIKDEENVMEESFHIPLPSRNQVVIALTLTLLGLALLKVLLWYGWVLSPSPRKKLLAMFSSIMYRLCDLGVERIEGETREEFRSRVLALVGADPLELTNDFNALKYGKSPSLDMKIAERKFRDSLTRLGTVPWHRKVLAAISPSSIFTFIGGART